MFLHIMKFAITYGVALTCTYVQHAIPPHCKLWVADHHTMCCCVLTTQVMLSSMQVSAAGVKAVSLRAVPASACQELGRCQVRQRPHCSAAAVLCELWQCSHHCCSPACPQVSPAAPVCWKLFVDCCTALLQLFVPVLAIQPPLLQPCLPSG